MRGRLAVEPPGGRSRATLTRACRTAKAAAMSVTTADPAALARDLLRCPSVTPAEGGALGLIEGMLQAGWLRRPSRHLRRAGHGAGREPLRPHRRRRPASRVRRPHRRGAAGRAGEMDASAVRRRDRGRHALRPRRGRHEGRDRLCAGRRARSSRRARRQAQGLDLVPDHRRRGRHRRQRHGEAAQMGGRARRKIRPLHPGRAEQRGGARRHHQDRPARLAERHAGHHRQAGPRRLSGARRQSGARTGHADERADGRRRSTKAARISTRRTSNSPRSISAIPSSISFPARRARASTSASTIITATLRSRC